MTGPALRIARISDDQTSAVSDSIAASYRVNDWLEEFKGHRSGVLKQIVYAALRPPSPPRGTTVAFGHDARAGSPVTVLRERGFPIESRRRWALAGLDVRDSVILVQGTGSGWDVLTWARHRPKRIIATDLFASRPGARCLETLPRNGTSSVSFTKRRSRITDSWRMRSIDVCVSDAVFEHCRNLDAVLAETRRVLKAGGRLMRRTGLCGSRPVAIIIQAGAAPTLFTTISCSRQSSTRRTSRANYKTSRIFRTAIGISNWISSRE